MSAKGAGRKTSAGKEPGSGSSGAGLRFSGQFGARKEIANFGGGGFRRIRAVGAIVLNAFAEFLANGAVSGFGGIRGAHGIAPFGDGVFRFENHDHGFTGAHEGGEFAEERAFTVNGVEPFGLLFSNAQRFDRDDLEFCRMNAADDVRGQAAAYGVRLDNCESSFHSHSGNLLGFKINSRRKMVSYFRFDFFADFLGFAGADFFPDALDFDFGR